MNGGQTEREERETWPQEADQLFGVKEQTVKLVDQESGLFSLVRDRPQRSSKKI